MNRTGWWMVFLESRAWSSSQFVRRWRYQFTVLLAKTKHSRVFLSGGVAYEWSGCRGASTAVRSNPAPVCRLVSILAHSPPRLLNTSLFLSTPGPLTSPFKILLSPTFPRFSTKTPLSGSNTSSPLGPRAPYTPRRNCRIDAASSTLFSTSPEARCTWYLNCGSGPAASCSVEKNCACGGV